MTKILIIFFLLLLSIKVSALTNITVSPEEILIEKGWMEYVNFEVNNSGDSDIHNVTIFLENSSKWFEFQQNTTDVIAVNNTANFVTKINIPNDTPIGSYNFYLKMKSNEISIEKNFIIRVFETTDDLLLYQVKSLRNDLSTLESQTAKIESTGKNMTSVTIILNQIRDYLDLSEGQITNKMYDNATENIINAEKLFIEAKFELTNPSKPEETNQSSNFNLSPFYLIIFSSVIIVLFLAVIIYLIRKQKIVNRIRTPNLKVKELVVDNKKINELEQEIEKIKESQVMIENEYKDNIVSKESYDELRLKYQQQLSELESEMKKLRGY